MCHTRTLHSRKQRDSPRGGETFRDKQKHGAPGHYRPAGAGEQAAPRRGKIRPGQEQAGTPPARRSGDQAEIRRDLQKENAAHIKARSPAYARERQSAEKVLRLFRQSTSALRALIVGIAANSHTCADRCVFCLGKAEAKNGF